MPATLRDIPPLNVLGNIATGEKPMKEIFRAAMTWLAAIFEGEPPLTRRDVVETIMANSGPEALEHSRW